MGQGLNDWYSVFSPKGWDNIARGNARVRGVDFLHPERVRQNLSQAFSLPNKSQCEPGATPRAMLSDPFGVKNVIL
jgi:hypothetical protein